MLSVIGSAAVLGSTAVLGCGAEPGGPDDSSAGVPTGPGVGPVGSVDNMGNPIGPTSPVTDPSVPSTGPNDPTDPVDNMDPSPDGMPDETPDSGPSTPNGDPACLEVTPGRAPLRRLTRFEYNNTIDALLGDDTQPANGLPAELLGNGFGNDADQQPTSSFLVEQYGVMAEDITQRLVSTSEQIAGLHACAASVTADSEATCARSIIESFVPRAYRRPLEAAEVDELFALQQELRVNGTFEESIAGLVQAVLQSPDFLYKVEFGEPDAASPALLRPTAHEMASRLSFTFWGSSPDDALMAAVDAGELSTPEGVRAQAARLLDDEKARPVVGFFFDHFLPLSTLTDLARDTEQYPTFSPTIGSLMRRETHTFLEYQIFQGPGGWDSALTAPYTFMNQQLAEFYGVSGVTGDEFVMVETDPTQRIGFLTQGGFLAGTTISNFTNPVRRGATLLREIMCVDLPPPPAEFADAIMPPDPYSGATARERYTLHLEPPEGVDPAAHPCPTCHQVMDPPGFALENYDAVGLWRDQENGVTIDASGEIAVLGGAFSGPIEMIEMIAENPRTYACFAEKWASFAYGRTLDAADACTLASLETTFTDSGYNVKELLLALTQTDAFLYLPAPEGSL